MNYTLLQFRVYLEGSITRERRERRWYLEDVAIAGSGGKILADRLKELAD